MQILFIDESGAPPPVDKCYSSPYFVLGGVIIPEEYWRQIKTDLGHLKVKYKINSEIKWCYFAPRNLGAKVTSLSHLSPNDKEQLRTDLFAILRKYKSVRIITVITHCELAYQIPYINHQNDLYWYAYKQITERFQYYLQDISKVSGQTINGIIVCDNRSHDEDKRLQELHKKLLTEDRNNYSKYQNLIEGVFIDHHT